MRVCVAPKWADRLDEGQSLKQVAVLWVEVSHLKCSYRLGLLLICDAAHIMFLTGHVPINDALQGAVVAANVLSPTLKLGIPVRERDLTKVQRQRELPIRFIQWMQARAQNAVFAQILNEPRNRVFTVPQVALPLLRASRLLALPARLLSFGLCPPHVQARRVYQ